MHNQKLSLTFQRFKKRVLKYYFSQITIVLYDFYDKNGIIFYKNFTEAFSIYSLVYMF